jgi:hypothetical protein
MPGGSSPSMYVCELPQRYIPFMYLCELPQRYSPSVYVCEPAAVQPLYVCVRAAAAVHGHQYSAVRASASSLLRAARWLQH